MPQSRRRVRVVAEATCQAGVVERERDTDVRRLARERLLEGERQLPGGLAGGLAAKGLAHARLIGAEAVQVFVANARGWATPAGDPAQDEEFRRRCAEDGVPVYVHAPYLINLGSHTPATAENSVASLRHSLRRWPTH